MTAAEIIAELERLGAVPSDCEYADLDREARWREEGVFLYVGSPIRNAVILGTPCEIAPRIAWVERKRKACRRTRVAFAPLDYVWRGGDASTEYYVVVMARPRTAT